MHRLLKIELLKGFVSIKLSSTTLLFYCILIQACYDNEELSFTQARARLQKEQAKQFYKDNKMLKQFALQRKLERTKTAYGYKPYVQFIIDNEPCRTFHVHGADVYEIPIAIPIDDREN